MSPSSLSGWRLPPLKLLLPAALALLILAPGPGAALFNVIGPGETRIPCAGELQCPDMTIDPADLANFRIETRTFAPTDCAVVEGSAKVGTQKLLLPGVATPNVGTADLVIGRPADNPTLFEWGACHGHWHYVAYVTLRVWTEEGYARWKKLRYDLDPYKKADEILALHPGLRDEFVAGTKVGFCVINVRSGYESRFPEHYTPSGHHPTCSDMGVTVGWADVYGVGTSGQWVMVGDLSPGRYVLEAEVNKDRLFNEFGDWRNNHRAVPVTIT